MAMLMHASLVASTAVIFMPAATAEGDLLTGILAWAVVLWVVIAGVALANGGRLAPRPILSAES